MEGLLASHEARERLRAAAAQGRHDEIVSALEADVVLALRCLRLANGRASSKGRAPSVAACVAALEPHTIGALADSAPATESFARVGSTTSGLERIRAHLFRTQGVAEHLLAHVQGVDGDVVITAALLHDLGKVALEAVDHEYWYALPPDRLTPEQRIAREREQYGTDHAAAGADVLRDLGAPAALAEAVGRHHAPDAAGEAAVVRLADMLARFSEGEAIDLDALASLSASLAIDRAVLARVLYEFPRPIPITRRRGSQCPLSDRELEVVRGLAAGKMYKQIARELALSPSTVRSHLHRIYSRLEVADRTQAVLLATERGWI